MEFEDVKVEKSEGIGKISIDRPPVNIMRLETISEMISALKELDEDPEIIAITITGKGEKAFSAGVEVEDHLGDKMPEMIEVFGDLFKTLLSIEKITIASVDGVALGGGCEFVAGCDLAIASDRARFGQPEIKLATFPPAAAALFPSIMGLKEAFELIMSGKEIGAEEAKRLGLVNKIVPPERLEEETEKFAGQFVEKSGPVLGMAKKGLYEIIQQRDFERAIDKAEECTIDITSTEDAVEGLTAFLEDREPKWKKR